MRSSAGLVLGFVFALQGCETSSAESCGGEDYCGPGPTDPFCAGEGAGYCVGDVQWECYADGSSAYHDCGDEPTPRTCVEGDLGIAFCAVSGEEEERCQAEPWPTLCDGGTLTLCREGFVEEVRTCPGGACIELEWRSFCALSAERDPRCMSEHPVLGRSFCDRNWIIDCVDGFATLSFDCGSRHCQQSGDGSTSCL
jgi:hypothetical protein